MFSSSNTKTIAKSILLTGLGLVLLLFVQVKLYAAKGDNKAKKGFVLKFSGFDFKSNNNSFFSLQPGIVYKGSILNTEKTPQQTTLQSILTYQKGNTTFIFPYKHKVVLPKFKAPEAPKF